MTKRPPVLLFAFANQQDAYLPLLKEEERHIRQCLSDLHDRQFLDFQSLGNTSLDDVYRHFNRFHNRIVLFHYAGHSGSEGLHLEGAQTRAANLATLMSMQEHLQLVVLNGCSNSAQAELLLNAGVKVVVGTTCAIQDDQAGIFATQFYDGLNKGKTIIQAFDSALAFLSDKKEIKLEQVVRGLGLHSDESQVPWGLYYRNENELHWTLPTYVDDALSADESAFQEDVSIVHQKVNQLLIPQVAQGLSRYFPEVGRLLQQFQQVKNPAIFLDLKDQVLNRFPTLISSHIGALFSPGAQPLCRLRLKQLNFTYLTLCRFLTGIALSNLWDAALDSDFVSKPDFYLRPEYRRDLLQFLTLNEQSAQHFDYFWLLATVQRILQDNGVEPFMTELGELHRVIVEDKAGYGAYRFLEQELRQPLAAGRIHKDDIGTLCLQAEQQLGKLLAECAFLSTYDLATIREIQVRKGKREAVASFLHENAVLRGTVDKTTNIFAIPRDEYTENQSIILSKDIFGGAQTLNLNPFIIDINAFSPKKRDLPDIHLWYCINDNSLLCYQRAGQMKDLFLVERDTPDAELSVSSFSVKYEGMEVLYQLIDDFKTDLKLL